jgi:hypothetical protein
MMQLLCASSKILVWMKWRYQQRDVWEEMLDQMFDTIEEEDNCSRLNEHIAILKKIIDTWQKASLLHPAVFSKYKQSYESCVTKLQTSKGHIVCSVIKLLGKQLKARDSSYYNAFEIYHLHTRKTSTNHSITAPYSPAPCSPEDAFAEAVSCLFLSLKINSAHYDRLSLNRVLAEYWVAVSDKPRFKSKHHIKADRPLFETHVLSCEARILHSLAYDFNVSPILLSNSVDGSLKQACGALGLSNSTFVAARNLLKEDYFLFSDFCIHYEDRYIVCAAIIIASSQVHKSEEHKKVARDSACVAKFGLEAELLAKLVYKVKNKGCFWFSCEGSING